MCQGTLDIKCITYKYQSCLTYAISSLLCRINRRHQIISLKTRICRSGSKGLRSDCICICGLLWLSCDLWWWFIMHVMMVYCEVWWWFIVNCDDGLLCMWYTIMPVMMLYCELWWFIMNWEGSVIWDRLVKKRGLVAYSAKRGIAECQDKTLGEETNFCYSGNLFCRVFWLCRVYSNGHSAKWP